MTEDKWPRVLASLPAGLTHLEVSRRLGTPYQQTRWAILKHGYKFSDGRRFSQNHKRKLDPATVDWKKPNVEIAAEYGVTRERVRWLRLMLGKPFVESRGRKPKNGCKGKPLSTCRANPLSRSTDYSRSRRTVRNKR